MWVVLSVHRFAPMFGCRNARGFLPVYDTREDAQADFPYTPPGSIAEIVKAMPPVVNLEEGEPHHADRLEGAKSP